MILPFSSSISSYYIVSGAYLNWHIFLLDYIKQNDSIWNGFALFLHILLSDNV